MGFFINQRERRCLQFRNVVSGPTLVAFKARLTLSTNVANQPECFVTTYTVVISHLLILYATDAVIAKPDEEIPNSKQFLFTACDFSLHL